MAINKLFILFLSLFLGTVALAKDETIVVKTEGKVLYEASDLENVRKKAILEAQRTAVEEAVGVYIEAHRTVEKSVLTEDIIRAKVRGRILSTTVLSEEVSAPFYVVKIWAKVSLSDNDVSLTANTMLAILATLNGQLPSDQELQQALQNPNSYVKSFMNKITAMAPNIPKTVLIEHVAKQLKLSTEELTRLLEEIP